MGESDEQFPVWLEATMRSRGLSQAQLARSAGVAQAQVSRWRRGLAVPTVQSLQRLAETLGVPRLSLEQLAGYHSEALEGLAQPGDAERRAELQSYQTLLGQLLEQRVPRELWQVYVSGCAALAEALAGSFQQTLQWAEDELQVMAGAAGADDLAGQVGEQLGFRTPELPNQTRPDEPDRALRSSGTRGGSQK